jgi:hypothetical protein
MRTSVGISSSLIVGLVAALVGAGVIRSTGEAGDGSRSQPNAGYPSYLINRPTCGTGEIYDPSQRFLDAYGCDFLSLDPEME